MLVLKLTVLDQFYITLPSLQYFGGGQKRFFLDNKKFRLLFHDRAGKLLIKCLGYLGLIHRVSWVEYFDNDRADPVRS